MTKRINFDFPNRTLIPVLVPIFLIISSSVYPAIMSSIQNRDMSIITEVAAQPEDGNQMKRNSYTASSDDERLRISEAHAPSPPTPIDPSFSASSPPFPIALNTSRNETQVQEEDTLTTAAMNTDDIINIVWGNSGTGSDIFYKRSSMDFQPPTENLSNNAGGSSIPAAAVSGNNIHVVWHDNTPGNVDILYARSTDGGATFSSAINLSNNAGSSVEPAIAVSGNRVFVVWEDNTQGDDEIFYTRSTNGGVSFGSVENVSFNGGRSIISKIAASGNSVHIVWSDNTPGNFDIFYKRSTDGGASFTEPTKNLSGNAGSSFRSDIAVSGSNVHVVWDDDTPGNLDILYRRSLDGGRYVS